jgi:hypothetical protein
MVSVAQATDDWM